MGTNDPFGFARDVYNALLVSDLIALLSRFQKVPPRIKVGVENASGGNAAWVGQGLPTAVLKSTSALTTLDVFKLQPSPAALLHARELHLSRGVSFWDAMILGACVDAKVEILYTEDLPAASIASPRLINPVV